MSTTEFKNIALLLKERILKLDYSDLYPEIKKDKLAEVIAPCAFWEKYIPRDSWANWNFIEFISLNDYNPTTKMGMWTDGKDIKIFLFSRENELTDLNNKYLSVLSGFSIGINHEHLFNEILTFLNVGLDYANRKEFHEPFPTIQNIE